MPHDSPAILVADDQSDVRESIRLLLKGEGYAVRLADSPGAALAAVEERDFDAALIDLNYTRDTTSGREGLDLLASLKKIDAGLPVVVMTAWGSIELAVEAMRRGAADFFEKPWDNERVLAILRTQVELRRARRDGERLAAAHRALRDDGQPEFIAESPAMREVLEIVERVGPVDADVLITGENGTGKGVVARLLHAVSSRSEKPLVTVNIGGISESLFESEMFGHVKGAFTDAKADRIGRFEMADGGTLFLDEIGNLPTAQQARLLRVVESGEFERVGASRTRTADVRILSATKADLEAAVVAGEFRKDLLYRLRTVEIALPPLRERREDIEPLAEHFLARHRRKYDRELAGVERDALAALRRHTWPGNVRELDHAVERAVLMARGERIAAGDLALERGAEAAETDLERLSLDEAEKRLVERALERNGGNVLRAAEELGVSRSALYRRIDKHGIELPG
ncbi:MAG: sigma-54 dependent transcriptional regulator [Thermoanaerobaculia bacterium]|nr:sigma-54 dependent transcriptional regulator [Thermoanaerobaculia bacterium]